MAFLRFVVVVAAMVLAACNQRSPVDPNWPDPDRGPKPEPINQDSVVSCGSLGTVYIHWDRMTPSEGGSARVGQTAQVWTTIRNDSGQQLVIRAGASDGPNDRPGELGRNSAIFQPGIVRFINPGATQELIFGFDVQTAETISHLRLSFNYFIRTEGADPSWQGGPWTPPTCTVDRRLDWHLG